MALLLLVLLLAVTWILYKLYTKHKEMSAVKIPGPRAYPLIGNALLLAKIRSSEDLLSVMKSVSDEFHDAGIARGWLGPLLFVIVYNPEYIEVLATSQDASNKGPLYTMMFGDGFKGVFTTDDIKKWKELRKPLNRLFTKKLLAEEQFTIFVKRSLDFVQYIRRRTYGNEIDVSSGLHATTVDIIAETHMGAITNELQIKKFNVAENLHGMVEYFIAKGTYNYILKTMNIKPKTPKEIEQKRRGLHLFYDWIFEERRKELDNSDSDGIEYYPAFLLRRQKEKKMESKEIFKEIGDILVAGSDTIGTSLSSAIVFLAMHPEIQEAAYKEQESIFGTDMQREPTFEDLSQMECLTMIIKETFRVTSTAVIYRLAKGDIKLREYTVPKGTVLGVYVEKLHHDPKYWERPGSFYPDHFLPEAEAARHKYAFIPFGFGLRTCPGTQFGITVMKTFISYILRNFKLSTTMKYEDITYKHNLLREMTNGYNVAFTERYEE